MCFYCLLASFAISPGTVCVSSLSTWAGGLEMKVYILFLALSLSEWGSWEGSEAMGSFSLWALLLLNFVVFYNQSICCPAVGWASHFDKSFQMVPHCLWDFCNVHLLGIFLHIFRSLCKVGVLSAPHPARPEGKWECVGCLVSFWLPYC